MMRTLKKAIDDDWVHKVLVVFRVCGKQAEERTMEHYMKSESFRGNYNRDMVVVHIKDGNGQECTTVFSLEGSPPKGKAVLENRDCLRPKIIHFFDSWEGMKKTIRSYNVNGYNETENPEGYRIKRFRTQ
jgi:hypothetical protein